MVGNFMLWVPVESGAWLFPQVSGSLFLLVLLSLILLWSSRSLRSLLGYIFINCTPAFHCVELKLETMLALVLYFCFCSSTAQQHHPFTVSLCSGLKNDHSAKLSVSTFLWLYKNFCLACFHIVSIYLQVNWLAFICQQCTKLLYKK